MESKYDWFLEQFDNCDEEEQIAMYNDFCERYDYEEDKIYPISDLSKVLRGYTKSQIKRMLKDNVNNSPDDYYFVYTDGEIETLDDAQYKIDEHIEDIFQYDEVWKNYIDINEYKENVFNEFLRLKPMTMSNEQFYDIVSNVVNTSYDINDDINDIKDEIKSYIRRNER